MNMISRFKFDVFWNGIVFVTIKRWDLKWVKNLHSFQGADLIRGHILTTRTVRLRHILVCFGLFQIIFDHFRFFRLISARITFVILARLISCYLFCSRFVTFHFFSFRLVPSFLFFSPLLVSFHVTFTFTFSLTTKQLCKCKVNFIF